MQCDKISYGSKRAARLASRGMRNTFRVYWCPDHHAWHVTSERSPR